MLNSFIEAQKFSVRRSLRRAFQPYLTADRDYNELLMHALDDKMREAEQYQVIRNKSAMDVVEVQMDDLEQQAREYKVYNLEAFFASEVFKKKDYYVDRQSRMICKQNV